MNKLHERIYERLRKRSLRARGKTPYEFFRDLRRGDLDILWDDEMHAAYVAGVKDGLDELADEVKSGRYEKSLRSTGVSFLP